MLPRLKRLGAAGSFTHGRLLLAGCQCGIFRCSHVVRVSDPPRLARTAVPLARAGLFELDAMIEHSRSIAFACKYSHGVALVSQFPAVWGPIVVFTSVTRSAGKPPSLA